VPAVLGSRRDRLKFRLSCSHVLENPTLDPSFLFLFGLVFDVCKASLHARVLDMIPKRLGKVICPCMWEMTLGRQL
jgi:hypothetical protein